MCILIPEFVILLCLFLNLSLQVLEEVDYEYPNISEPWTADDTCKRPQWPHSKDNNPHHRRNKPHHRRQHPHIGEGLQDEAESPAGGEEDPSPSAEGGSFKGDVMFDDEIDPKPIKRIDADPVRKFDVFMPVIEDFFEPKNQGTNTPEDNFPLRRPGDLRPRGGTTGKTVNTRNRSPYDSLREEFDAMEKDLENEVHHHHSSSLDGYRDRTAHKTRFNSSPRNALCPMWLTLAMTSLVVVVVSDVFCSSRT